MPVFVEPAREPLDPLDPLELEELLLLGMPPGEGIDMPPDDPDEPLEPGREDDELEDPDPEEPDEPDEELGEPVEGMPPDDEDDCCSTQPPIRSMEMEPTSAACTATVSNRFLASCPDMAAPLVCPIREPGCRLPHCAAAELNAG